MATQDDDEISAPAEQVKDYSIFSITKQIVFSNEMAFKK